MKTAKQILRDHNITLISVEEENNIMEAMYEFAKQEVAKNLHKPLVIKSVCDCNPKTSHWLDKKTGKDMCMKCSKEIAN